MPELNKTPMDSAERLAEAGTLLAKRVEAKLKKRAGYCPLRGEHSGDGCSCGWPNADDKADREALARWNALKGEANAK